MEQFQEKMYTINNLNKTQYFKKKDQPGAEKNYNQQACVLAIGPQNSGKSYLFNQIMNLLKDKKNSYLFFVSSLPQREINKEIEKMQIDNFEVFTHNDKQDYFKQIYDKMTEFMDYFYQGEELKPKKQTFINQLAELKKQFSQGNKKVQLQLQQIQENLQKIAFYEKNKNTNIKFFIFVDDLIKLKPQQIPYFELILRNYRHLGGVLMFVTAQDLMVIPRQLRDLFTHICLFGRISIARLETIQEQQRLPINPERILQIYYNETHEPHSYIIICTGNGIPAIQSKNNIYLFY